MNYTYTVKATRKGIKQPTSLKIRDLGGTERTIISESVRYCLVTAMSYKPGQATTNYLIDPETGVPVGDCVSDIKTTMTMTVTLMSPDLAVYPISTIEGYFDDLAAGGILIIVGGEFSAETTFEVKDCAKEVAEGENVRFTLDCEINENYTPTTTAL